MFCPNCGKEISDDATFCGFCGAKIENSGVNQQQSAETANVETQSQTWGNVQPQFTQNEQADGAFQQEQPVQDTKTEQQKANSVSAGDIANKATARQRR